MNDSGVQFLPFFKRVNGCVGFRSFPISTVYLTVCLSSVRVKTQWIPHHLTQASLFGSEDLFHRKSVALNRVEVSKHATLYLASPHAMVLDLSAALRSGVKKCWSIDGPYFELDIDQ